jgi:hypothetical protein
MYRTHFHPNMSLFSANCSKNHQVVKNKTVAIANDEIKQELLKMPCIKNLVLQTSVLSCSRADGIESIIDKGGDENDLLLSPSSPGLMISLEPLGLPLSLTLSQRQRQSQLQQNDKLFPFQSYDLCLVRVPSLSSITRDPAAFGCSKRIEAN